MLVVIDIGNTNISIGLYKEDSLVANYRLTTKLKRTSDEYGFMMINFLHNEHIHVQDIEDVIIASVVPKIMYSFSNSIRKYLKKEPIIVGPGLKSGISIRIDNPKELGADRLVDAVAAHYVYGGDLIVIDFGTATTFDYISSQGEYLGGATSAGIEITSQALSTSAAKLPEVAIKDPQKILATNTIDSMQAGIFYGYLGQTEYIIKKLKAEIGRKSITVIATGGLGRTISQGTNSIDIYDGDLSFKGLKIIYEKNKKN